MARQRQQPLEQEMPGLGLESMISPFDNLIAVGSTCRWPHDRRDASGFAAVEDWFQIQMGVPYHIWHGVPRCVRAPSADKDKVGKGMGKRWLCQVHDTG